MSISKSIFIGFLACGFLAAQNRPVLPIGGNGEEAGGAAPQNLTQSLAKPDPNALYPGSLELLNFDGYAMAALYQTVTGKRVIVPSSVKDAQFSFVQSPGLTNREVAELLEQFLLIEGYQLNPSIRNPDIVTLLAAQQGGGTAGVSVPPKVLTEPSQLALETGIVTYIMKFQFLKPEEAQRAFISVYGQLRPGGTIAEASNASALIITEKATLIQSLLKIKELIDVPSAEVGIDWVEVQYADVLTLAEQLNEMFSAQSSQNQSAGVQRQQPRGNTPQIPGLPTNNANVAGSAAGEDNPPTITADSRTNRLFLMGRPNDLEFIKELIAQWDVRSNERNFLSRKFNYLPVSEFMTVAERAINATLGGDADAAGGGGNRSTAGADGRSLGNNDNNNAGGANGNNATPGNGNTASASLSGSDGVTVPESFLVGSTLLVGDNIANTLIVRGPPHHIEVIEELADQLDVKQQQVAITAVFGRFAVTDGRTFGVNLAQLLNGNGIGFGTTNGGGGGGIIENGAITEFTNLISPASGLAAAGIAGDFGVFVSAMEEYTQFKAFATPTIFTTNNKEARISSGTQIAIPTNTFQGLNGAAGQSTNVDFRSVALELLVRPLVNSEEEVTLEISIVRDTIGQPRNIGELTIPDLLSDQLDTIVTVPVGSAVVLGGLIDEDDNSSDSGVPILRSIPLLGQLFNSNDDEYNRSELVIMIRPTIVGGRVNINQFQDIYDRQSDFNIESRRQFGSRQFEGQKNLRLNTQGFGQTAPLRQQRQAIPRRQLQQQAAPIVRRPSSPTQQAIFDKKQRLARENANSRRLR